MINIGRVEIENRSIWVRVRESLIHETIHYMASETLFKEWCPPAWLNEGLAQYFECSLIKSKGEMVLGRIDKEEYSDFSNRVHYYSRGMNNVKFMIKNRKILQGIVVENLVSGKINAVICGSDEENLFYAASFALVNFLLGSEKDGFNPSFFTYIDAIRKGDDPIQKFEEIFGNYHDVEKGFWKHIKKLD